MFIFPFQERYFPSAGEPGYIMLKQIDMGQEFSQIQNLVHRLTGESKRSWDSLLIILYLAAASDVIDNISPWDQAFKDYVNKIKREEEPFEELIKNETYFREKFTQFLYSPRGGIFQVKNDE